MVAMREAVPSLFASRSMCTAELWLHRNGSDGAVLLFLKHPRLSLYIFIELFIRMRSCPYTLPTAILSVVIGVLHGTMPVE